MASSSAASRRSTATNPSKTKVGGKTPVKGPRPASYLAPLRSTRLLDSEKTPAALPAEILAMILDYLPIPELMRFAQTSKRMLEMVYDDSRWVQKLQMIGCWDEKEARRRLLDESRRKGQETAKRNDTKSGLVSSAPGGSKAQPQSSTKSQTSTVLDGEWEEHGSKKLQVRDSKPQVSTAANGSNAMPITSTDTGTHTYERDTKESPVLHVLENVRSIRGQARQEYGKVYASLQPFYVDIARARSHSEPKVFKVFGDPQQQGKMLAQLRSFAKGDTISGWQRREEALETMIAVFENAVLREFEKGYQLGDVDGGMRTYAHVLVTLNGGAAAIDLYIHNHKLMQEKEQLGHPLACLQSSSLGETNLSPMQAFFENLLNMFNEDSAIIDKVFPPSTDVLTPFLRRISEEVLSEYVNTLFDEAHDRNMDTYLKVVAGVAEQSFKFARSIRPAISSPKEFHECAIDIVVNCFEPHVDLYLREEFEHLKTVSSAKVDRWDKQLSAQEASAESFFMSNVARQAAKQDFMSSFKKVVMMPVNTIAIPFAALNKATAGETNKESHLSSQEPPIATQIGGTTTPTSDVPTTELAAKAAIMNSKLEGIGTLFSLEIALDLVHTAKASLERAATFSIMGGRFGEESKAQCEAIFIQLLQTLGFRHVKSGFDKAVGHLSQYNAHEVHEHGQAGSKPLMTFLELVNVGDLIQQMLDVFYMQELVATKLTDPDDFLNPAGKEKKKFEQMLDERVAAGLNTGLDVLVSEIAYVLETTQSPTDFNPGAGPTGNLESEKNNLPAALDIGPTTAANQVVALLSSHTSMLAGSTDKNTLDVFNQEVGLRLFAALCKHVKRQRISTTGAIKLIADMNAYFDYVQTLRNKQLLQYFVALRELSQIFLIEVPPPGHGRTASAKEVAAIVADVERYRGIFKAEEVLEFAERRADWYSIRNYVEKALYGIGCCIQ